MSLLVWIGADHGSQLFPWKTRIYTKGNMWNTKCGKLKYTICQFWEKCYGTSIWPAGYIFIRLLCKQLWIIKISMENWTGNPNCTQFLETCMQWLPVLRNYITTLRRPTLAIRLHTMQSVRQQACMDSKNIIFWIYVF